MNMLMEKVRLVKQIGGLTLSDAVKRAWGRVLSMEVRAVVNWAGIRLAPEFEQVFNATHQEETRKAVKHAAETLRNKQQRAFPGSCANSDVVRSDIRIDNVRPIAVDLDVRLGVSGCVSSLLWIEVCYQGSVPRYLTMKEILEEQQKKLEAKEEERKWTLARHRV
ncbi:hypothetical protein GHT06_009915 [Daphnia sinensis]|uniref:Uncharacterized protein n=1 Tax=Daphnia sinensis TaxID=1820382 RepID=A0AAD5KZH9_9CRUS|nr:hypothetical protein GHT06_009915 [Daphnia sinensis]